MLTKANRHDISQLMPLVEAIPPLAGKPGRPLRKPDCVQGDRGYDSQPNRDTLHERGIRTELAKRGTPHGSGLGKARWAVERSIAWLVLRKYAISVGLTPRCGFRRAVA